MPCHHTLDGHLAEYMERARLAEAGRVPLFQAIKARPYGHGEAAQRRAAPPDQCLADGAPARLGGRHHARSVQPDLPWQYRRTWRTVARSRRPAKWRCIRRPASPALRRREDRVTLDEVVKINFRG